MTETVNIYEARTHLSRLVERAGAGEDIVIARAGLPLVRPVPVEHPRRRPPPALAGEPVPSDMLTPMSEEELAEWE